MILILRSLSSSNWIKEDIAGWLAWPSHVDTEDESNCDGLMMVEYWKNDFSDPGIRIHSFKSVYCNSCSNNICFYFFLSKRLNKLTYSESKFVVVELSIPPVASGSESR